MVRRLSEGLFTQDVTVCDLHNDILSLHTSYRRR